MTRSRLVIAAVSVLLTATMGQAQTTGMQRLTIEIPDNLRETGTGTGGYAQSAAIYGVANQRMLYMGHVYANLMGPSRLELNVYETMVLKLSCHLKMCNRRFTFARYCHLFTVDRMAGYFCFDTPASSDQSLRYSDIFALYQSALQLIDQPVVRF